MNRHVTPSRTMFLIIHIVGASALLGSELALLGLGVAGLSGATATEVYPAASLIAHWITLPAAATTLASGVGIGLVGRWRLDKVGWVQIKLGITLVLTGLLLAVLLPRISSAAGEATLTGAVSDSSQRRLAIASAIGTATILFNVLLGTLKPRRARPRRERTVPDEAATRT